MTRFTDEQISLMAKDGYPPPEYDCVQTITVLAAEVARLRAKLSALEKGTKVAGETAEWFAKDNNELRVMLRSACIELCHDCEACVDPHPNYKCVSAAGSCFVQEWRLACGLNGGLKPNKENEQ